MRYIWQHINIILNQYKGEVPLATFLKTYCKSHKSLGSRDRKLLSDLAYSWYRCSKGIHIEGEPSFERSMHFCLHLCGKAKALQLLFNQEQLPVGSFDAQLLLPVHHSLSQGISREAWLQGMLQQPDLFLRIRTRLATITHTLEEHNIAYRVVNDHCLALPTGSAVDAVLAPESYVVQDASSQQTGDFFNALSGERWLDCCAGAGGKSLLLKDKVPDVQLTVADIRKSILVNLTERFQLYGHQIAKAHVVDFTNETQTQLKLKGELFDHIICDAPCSGSGTWARTPEQLYFFNPTDLHKFTQLQTAIATNATACLKKGGSLYYITCSVFAAENESAVEQLIRNTSLSLTQSSLINGLENKADSMFVAKFEKL